MSLNAAEEKAAYDLGYQTYQNRRGLNPYPVAYPLWLKFEEGWEAALRDKASDTSAEWLTLAEAKWKEKGIL